MSPFLLALAVSRARAEWRLLLGLAFGTVVGVALLASAPIYLRALDDLGLQSTLRQQIPSDLDVRISATSLRADGPAYADANQRTLASVGGTTAAFIGATQRFIRSATFYLTPDGQPPRTDAKRPRGHFQFVSELEEHATIREGAEPSPLPAGPPPADFIDVLVSDSTAARLGVTVGQQFALEAFWLSEPVTLRARVAGTVAPNDAAERYWSDRRYFDVPEGDWDTYVFFATERALFDQLAVVVPGLRIDGYWTFIVDRDGLNGGNADAALDAVTSARTLLGQRLPDAEFDSTLPVVLTSYRDRLVFARVPLFVLIFQIELIVLFYIVIVSSMVIERQSAEIAVFKSRGAGQRQMFVIYLLQAVLIALLALAIGPPLAAAGVAALGATPTFQDLSDGDLLTVVLGHDAYLLALAGAGLSILALVIPAFHASRVSIVQHRQAAARQLVRAGFRRYYVDLVLIASGSFLFWRTRQQAFVTLDRTGETTTDPLLLLSPALFTVTAALIFLRLFPVVLALLQRVVAPWRSTSGLLALQYMVRSPAHYGRLIFLLILATSLGLFASSFGATLQRSYDDRARYDVGTDVRFDFAAAAPTRDITNIAAGIGRQPGVAAATPAIRLPGSLARSQRDSRFTLLAVEPRSFGDAAWWRGDFAGDAIDDLMGRLARETVTPGVALPPAARSFGVWARIPEPKQRLYILARALDANGQYFDYVLGATSVDRPVFASEPAPDGLTLWGADGAVIATGDEIAGWNYLSTLVREPLDLSTALGLGRQNFETPTPPIRLVSLYFEERSAANEAGGATVVLDDVSAGRGEDAEVIDGFEQSGAWELVPPEGVSDAPDVFELVTDDVHAGGFAARYSWTTASTLQQTHGIRISTPLGAAMPVLVNAGLLDRVNRAVGDTLRLAIGTHEFDVMVVGDFDLFPTFLAEEGDLIVANLAETRLELNRIPGSGGIRAVNEIWVKTRGGAPASGIDLPGGSRPSDILEAATEREKFRLDPLIETGWQGVLLIAFLTIAVLSSLGTLIYSYLAAQARRLDFAVLRTMGLSSNQIFGLVGFEQLLVVTVGMLSGTLIGTRLGVLLLASLELTESGQRVTPPYVMEVNWLAAGIAYGVIALAFAVSVLFLVLFFSRLSLSRMLRIGDG